MVLRHSVGQNLHSLPSSHLALYMELKGMIAGNCKVQIRFLSFFVSSSNVPRAIRPIYGNSRQAWILDSTPWIPDFNRSGDSGGFFELNYGFQNQNYIW